MKYMSTRSLLSRQYTFEKPIIVEIMHIMGYTCERNQNRYKALNVNDNANSIKTEGATT